MSIAIVTGAAGLIGAECVRRFAAEGLDVVGIDNDMRAYFFGRDASTAWSREQLEASVRAYRHESVDIRNEDALKPVFARYGMSISVIVHAAAQPSHDWAVKEPMTDFGVNAVGTLNMLEMTRQYCPDAVFIFTSTNKVYGDAPNHLPLVEQDRRWELAADHPYYEHGINESMSVDQTLHSLFGASKLAADVLVQEYGRYFNMKTACFRGGCLTGPGHSGAELHGFLAYLARCVVTGHPYTVFGYKGKQVRDNIHAADLVDAFLHFYRNPRQGEVYNIGGGRHANCSMLEAIDLVQEVAGRELAWSYSESNRIGDHIWWISDTSRFQKHYPEWLPAFGIRGIIEQVVIGQKERA